MGACYSVTLDISLKDEQAAIKVLQEQVSKIKCMQEDLGKVDMNTFDGMMKLYLADHQSRLDIQKTGNRCIYNNDFNATYSWEAVLYDMFKAITPFLEEGSKMEVFPDNGYTKHVVVSGKCVCTEDEYEEEEDDE